VGRVEVDDRGGEASSFRVGLGLVLQDGEQLVVATLGADHFEDGTDAELASFEVREEVATPFLRIRLQRTERDAEEFTAIGAEQDGKFGFLHCGSPFGRNSNKTNGSTRCAAREVD